MRARALVVAGLVVGAVALVVAFALIDDAGDDPAPVVNGGQAARWLPPGVSDEVVERLVRKFSPAYVDHPDERYPRVTVQSIDDDGVRTQRDEPVAYWLVGGPRADGSASGDAFTVQYWTYYEYNAYDQPGPDFNHEGDWERVALEFEARRVRMERDEAMPTRIFYGHHALSEEQAFSWGDRSSFELVGGSHPAVWVALGSHGLWPKCGRVKRAAKVLWMSTYDRLAPCGATPSAIALARMPVGGWACYRGRWGNDTGRITGKSPYGPRFQQAPFGNRAAC